MTASEIAAWWGAVIATGVLLWDIYKWKNRGARITVTATPNMREVDYTNKKLKETVLVSVNVSNEGDSPTTFTHLVVFNYKTRLHKILGKKKSGGLVLNQSSGIQLPHVLNPGEMWHGLIRQLHLGEKLGEGGVYYCDVFHSTSNKPILTRIKSINDESQPPAQPNEKSPFSSGVNYR